MHRVIKLEDALSLDNPIFVDMRSPSEYAIGHIPGAYNVPLFSDDERAEVGTVYKQVGADEAKHLGLSIVSSKLPHIVRTISNYHQTGRTVIVYCWRGGMRSKSVVTILEIMGIPAYQLLGGYKIYRNYVLEEIRDFKLAPEIIVLCGSTGVGKTTLLNLLAKKGANTIDLERLANHRGSAFGHIGIGAPATAQNFDAAILNELKAMNDKPYIVVECESKRIGNVYVPDALFEGMKKGKRILISADMDTRICRLIEEYTNVYNNNYNAIISSIKTLGKKLGKKRTDILLSQMASGQIGEVVHTLLIDYYDPLYGYQTTAPDAYNLIICADNFEEASSQIMDYLNSLGR